MTLNRKMFHHQLNSSKLLVMKLFVMFQLCDAIEKYGVSTLLCKFVFRYQVISICGTITEVELWLQKNITIFPADTRCRFNVNKTSIHRLINVEMTSCV